MRVIYPGTPKGSKQANAAAKAALKGVSNNLTLFLDVSLQSNTKMI